MRRTRIKMMAAVMAATMLLGGCGDALYDLTDDEENVIVNYAAHIVTKYNTYQREGLTYVSPEEPEETQEDVTVPQTPETQDASETGTAASAGSCGTCCVGGGSRIGISGSTVRSRRHSDDLCGRAACTGVHGR